MLACRRWKAVLVGNENVHGLPLDGLNPHIVENFFPGKLGKLFWKMGIMSPGIAARLKSFSASLVHVHFGIDAVVWWPVLRKLGLPIAVTLHGYDIHTYREFWESQVLKGMSRYPKKLLDLAISWRLLHCRERSRPSPRDRIRAFRPSASRCGISASIRTNSALARSRSRNASAAFSMSAGWWKKKADNIS